MGEPAGALAWGGVGGLRRCYDSGAPGKGLTGMTGWCVREAKMGMGCGGCREPLGAGR